MHPINKYEINKDLFRDQLRKASEDLDVISEPIGANTIDIHDKEKFSDFNWAVADATDAVNDALKLADELPSWVYQ